jgi:hypothetical protein
LLGTACEKDAPRAAAKPAPSVSASVSRAAPDAPRPRDTRAIPAGTLRAGSTPGDPGRQPELEPKNQPVELGPFRIDRLPYPNDPALPTLLGQTRDEARRWCAERGARLCTELEWERACKGPRQDTYPSGAIWDPSCTRAPESCASGFDVLGLGTTASEWVSNEVELEDGKRRALLRGAAADAPGHDHRCARRTPAEPNTSSQQIAFRCCHDAPNAAAISPPKPLATFRQHKLGADELERLLAQHPSTEELARDVKFFREPEGAQTVVARGPGDKKGFDFTVAPLLWSPSSGVEVLLVSARSGEDRSFVVAFHVIEPGVYSLASSFVLLREPGPVALAYTPDIRPRVHFSTCWGCPGETGKALFRKPETIVLVQP